MKRYDCRYQEICRTYNPNSKTCKDDGGWENMYDKYCVKHKKLDRVFEKKPRENLLNLKNLLLEVIPEHDIF